MITSRRAQAAALGLDASVSIAEGDTPGADERQQPSRRSSRVLLSPGTVSAGIASITAAFHGGCCTNHSGIRALGRSPTGRFRPGSNESREPLDCRDEAVYGVAQQVPRRAIGDSPKTPPLCNSLHAKRSRLQFPPVSSFRTGVPRDDPTHDERWQLPRFRRRRPLALSEVVPIRRVAHRRAARRSARHAAFADARGRAGERAELCGGDVAGEPDRRRLGLVLRRLHGRAVRSGRSWSPLPRDACRVLAVG